MERLTIDEAIKKAREVAKDKRADADWKWIHGRLNSDDCISCAEEHEQLAEWLEKLKAYEQAEEDGLLIRLPCPIGTTVYYAQKCQAPSCRSCLKFSNCYCEFKARIFEQSFDYRHLHAFGHSVFLTKAEAEQALAKMKGE